MIAPAEASASRRDRSVRSIRSRLLVGTASVLAVFVILTAIAVSWSVHERAEQALVDRLRGLVYGILGATTVNLAGELRVNEIQLPDQLLLRPVADRYAEIVSAEGRRLWQSRSIVETIPPVEAGPLGEWRFTYVEDARQPVHDLQFTTLWEVSDDRALRFVVHVVVPAADLGRQLRGFDRTLVATLFASAVLLLLLQYVVLDRSLAPLGRLRGQLDDIERGRIDRLDEDAAIELQVLARSVNALIASERHRHRQFRDLLDDLAHSLKTPLSVLRNVATDRGTSEAGQATAPDGAEIIVAQTDAIQRSLARYLQRAHSRSALYLAPPCRVLPVAERLARTLAKLYPDTNPQIEFDMPDTFAVRVAETDLHEILGNLLENACKYGARRVLTHAQDERTLIVDDDGPGFPEQSRSELLVRGARADRLREGTGLGLAASAELMRSYGGELELDSAPTGGARVWLRFS